MAGTPKQRMKLLYLMKILLEQTDAEHPLTLREIIDALAEFDVKAERKSLYTDLELLRTFGLDIETTKSKTVGYYIDAWVFQLPELKLLVDAVQGSRFITQQKSRELIQKLSALASAHQTVQLQRQMYIVDRPKNNNEDVYYAVDAIHSAIGEKRKICFRYIDYDLAKRRVYRKGAGSTYTRRWRSAGTRINTIWSATMTNTMISRITASTA